MARFYSNENFPLLTVVKLRELGHEVVTALEAGNANQRISDEAVLAFAITIRVAASTPGESAPLPGGRSVESRPGIVRGSNMR
jgi:hypothetical protein